MLRLDGDRDVTPLTCTRCGRQYLRIVGFLLRDGDATAIYRAALHGHDDDHETWIDVTFESDWDDPELTNRVSFGCRVGQFEGASEPAASLVTAGLAYTDVLTFGVRLARDEALVHPRLREFWEVVDWVLTEDMDVERHTYRHT